MRSQLYVTHRLNSEIENALASKRSTLWSCKIVNKYKYTVSYYIDESVLLGTKPLVDSIRHFIRDTSDVFSVCHHLCECRIVQ